ncbi:hypothetical protein FGD67_06215 [Colwellia sp. M166]|uniref:hypothetical protein n=1 Tax=Colwellia sp. M166 TaxID=2583805 RepID=UPI00211E213B|nr:hypothetical protein [Colwellia sp. M166]UUO22825.1 hypothetical protein FGD67_06215 [Colwellia sp. M166]
MACKIAVLKDNLGKKRKFDCLKAYNVTDSLGAAVEPVGGHYLVLVILDRDKDDADIISLTSPWVIINPTFDASDEDSSPYISHPEFDRKFNVDLSNLSITDDRLEVNMSVISELIVERDNA